MTDSIGKLHEMMKEAYQPIVDMVFCVSPFWRIFDYDAWYEARQRELEAAFPPRI